MMVTINGVGLRSFMLTGDDRASAGIALVNVREVD
jgi:hypothetical protein